MPDFGDEGPLQLGSFAAGDTLRFSYVIEGVEEAMTVVSVNEDPANWQFQAAFTRNLFCPFRTDDQIVVKIESAPQPLEILDANLNPTEHVQIARWDNAYDTGGDVINEAFPGQTFTDLDPEAFYLRLTDPAKNEDATVFDEVAVEITTRAPSGDAVDTITPIALRETGVNTGVFESVSLLLMAPDLPVNPDDDFEVQSGLPTVPGPIADDQLNDRTYQAELGGVFEVMYESEPGTTVEATARVCAPDLLKRLELQLIVFNEPYLDVGYEDPGTGELVGADNGIFDYVGSEQGQPHQVGVRSEPYRDLSSLPDEPFSAVELRKNLIPFRSGDDPRTMDARGGVVSAEQIQAQLDRARIAWAQACIDVVQVGNTLFIDAPSDADGRDVLWDGVFDLPIYILPNPFNPIISDAEVVHTAFEPTLDATVPTVYFTGPMPVRGYAFPPENSGPAEEPGFEFDYGSFSFTFIRPNTDPALRVLAHELGHLLTGQSDGQLGDPPQPRHIFFPALFSFKDTNWTLYRRVSEETATAARQRSLLKPFIP